MKYLLDTHTFLWTADSPDQLTPKVRAILKDQGNELILSVVTVWEIQIKLQIGKLALKLPLEDLISQQQKNLNLTILPATLNHVFALAKLPLHHADPFDRFLIAQAITENATILSSDSAFKDYPVEVVWKEQAPPTE